jgi:hypothetical protein
VAFMLVHYFWLLEFKFMFEFYLFESFPKFLSLFLFPIPFPFFISACPTFLAQQPALQQQ